MNPSLRKAAVLISVLDTRTVDALLEQMGPEQAARVRAAAIEIEEISAEEQQRVLREFLAFQRTEKVAEASGAGVELDASLLQRLSAGDEHPTGNERPAGDGAFSSLADQKPLRWLAELPAATLVRYLMRERTQVLAVVLAHLPPPQAAEVLSQLPAESQAEVAERLVYLDAMDPSIIAEIESALRRQLADEIELQRRRASGLQTLETIVAAAPVVARQRLLDSIARHDEELVESLSGRIGPVPRREALLATAVATASPLGSVPATPAAGSAARPERGRTPAEPHPAEQVSPAEQVRASPERNRATAHDEPPFPFSSLTELNDRMLCEVLRSVEPEIVLLALAGATPELTKRVFQRLARSEARQLQRQIESLGPIRLRDVEEAQRRVGVQAARIIDQRRHAPTTGRPRAAA